MNEKLKNIALVSVMYDYPDWHQPIFYEKIQNYFDESNVHILKYNNLKEGLSYYEKFFFYKIEKLRDYIEENLLGKYEHILFLDATDTAFTQEPVNIVELFESFNKSIVFCAEKGLWPPTEFNHLYEEKPKTGEAFYLNSGSYFGLTKAILDHLNEIVTKPISIDDQGSWAIRYLTNDDICLDHDRKIFFSTYESKNRVNIVDGKVEFNDIDPLIIHDNGPHTDETIKLCEYLKK